MFKRFKDNIRSSRYRRNASRFVKVRSHRPRLIPTTTLRTCPCMTREWLPFLQSSLLADAGFVSALQRLAPPLMELSDILVTELPPDGQVRHVSLLPCRGVETGEE